MPDIASIYRGDVVYIVNIGKCIKNLFIQFPPLSTELLLNNYGNNLQTIIPPSTRFIYDLEN